jgi:hypothetical protein
MTGERAYSPDRFLAIAAGAHALVDAISASAYPIASWTELKQAASNCSEFTIRGPNGIRLNKQAVIESMDRLEHRVGNSLFPIHDADEFAHRAGMILTTLVLSHHRMREAQPGGEPFSAERKQNIIASSSKASSSKTGDR